MKSRLIAAVIPVLMVLFPTIMPAADLPVLPADSKITSGQLENGVSYYIINNKTEAGRVDISLLQRFGTGSEDQTSRGFSVVHSMGALTSLPRFRTPAPLKYLVTNRVWPGPEGYVTLASDATVFRFRNIPVISGLEAVDSTLLMVFEIIKAAPGVSRGLYPNSGQAIIISGDIATNVAKSKMYMLSMLVEKREQPFIPTPYIWEDRKAPQIEYTAPKAAGLATLKITWHSPRTPQEQMNTIQPLVSGVFFRELALLSEKRLAKAFRDAGIVAAGIKSAWTGSGLQPGDETFTVSASVAPKDYSKAVDIVLGVMANLNKKGASLTEYKDIHQTIKSKIALEGSVAFETNASYTERCISSFLYGSSLATPAIKASYITGRTMDKGISLRIFNSFASATLGSTNLRISCIADSSLVTRASLKDAISKAWENAHTQNHSVESCAGDTLHLAMSSSKKAKIIEMAEDPMAGGQVYTFSNGIRVVFKQTSDKGIVRYSWNQKGGYSMIPNLKEGEGAFISDLLLLENIGSMHGRRFVDMLSANGISMLPEVSINGLSIRGSAPSDKLMLLMKSLASLAWKRSVDTDAFERYCSAQMLERQLEANDKLEYDYQIDSMLCPKGLYSTVKRDISLSKNLPAKAEEYFARQFSNMSSGVLVLVGDINETALRKVLLSYIGRLPAGKVTPPRFRSNARFSRELRSVTKPESDKPGIYLGYTVPYVSELSNFIAAGIAAEAIGNEVSRTVTPYGWTSSCSWQIKLFPEERLTVKLALQKADYRGLPASIRQEDSVQMVLSNVQKALDDLCDNGISEEVFNNARAYITGDCQNWAGDSDFLLHLLELRYNFGKDFLSGIAEKSSRITKVKITEILKSLFSGGAAEIIIPRKYVPEQFTEVKPQELPLPDLDPPAPIVDSTGVLDFLRTGILKEEVWQPMEQ